MKKNFEFDISYSVDGVNYTADRLKCDHFEIVLTEKEELLKAIIYPKCTISNLEISIICTHLYAPDSKIFVNGYQSWSATREFSIDEKLPRANLFGMALKPLKAYGDENFFKYPPRGVFHAYTYGYIRDYNKVCLYGSMSERSGFTILKFNAKHNSVTISKDLEGLTIDSPYEVFNIGYFEGEYDEVFDRYFSLQCLPGLRLKSLTGYSTCLTQGKKVNFQDCIRDLLNFKMLDVCPMYYEIASGYQSKIGDWLTPKKGFGDMKNLVANIHSQGIRAGLWLAPFACVKSSSVFKEHKDWLLKDAKGKFVKGGLDWDSINGFYVLDVLNPNVQDHLRKTIGTIVNDWDFDTVKLDYLYTACIIPRQNKTRGQIMCEAMDFLRDCVGNKLIIGSGVPLGPAFGKVDFCRVSCDIQNKKWNIKTTKSYTTRESSSTTNMLTDTIFRRHLNGRAFVNDPGFICLREKDTLLNEEQRLLITDVNKLFGGVLVISDDVSTYSEKSLDNIKDIFKEDEIEILEAEFMTKTIISISYTINGIEQELVFDLQLGRVIRG